ALHSLMELDASEFRESSDEAGLAVMLAHIVDHLCLAWHRRWTRYEDKAAVTHDDWNTMSSAIPNWDSQFVLKEQGIEYPVVGGIKWHGDALDQSTILKYLRAAEVALRELRS